ncbi:membrane protein, MarC family [Spongiibacter sp. IMCC21906]|jgi:multiple antibiotic resistance protein|uniref:MarC family protein n=1 Tax=Spongiibacter sp. IMCC21906 TaxID=1620392 RepID=UPI00062DE1ED|nr:MarC family protein [Spongiibacter sp. IMCC21906]AKH69472.1 membrane protein, MarC family [Spongiibacter sp. IMCC21906]
MALTGVLESFTLSLTTFFAMIGPIDVAAMFAALSAGLTERERRRAAVRGVLIASGILLAFALVGEWVLNIMGISLAALRTAGGVLLLLIGIELVSARASGATTTTLEEDQEAEQREDISVFPLATPLIAGPGAIGAVILLMAHAEGNFLEQSAVVVSLILVMAMTLLSLLLASQLQDRLGVTGMHMISRVFGVLLCALAVQFLFDGIAQSGLLSGTLN